MLVALESISCHNLPCEKSHSATTKDAMSIGATAKLVLLFVSVLFLASEGHSQKHENLDKDEYEDVPDRPFPGKIQIMPIVQRDTKHKDVSETVEEIIRELPNDEQYERIGKMLNNSYDAVSREVAEGKSAYRQKMVRAEGRLVSTNSAVTVATSCAAFISLLVGISIIVFV